MTGDPVVAQEYCPVNGRFVFTYSVNDGLADDHVNVAENVNECHEPVSELSNCPYGFGLGLRFKRCSFGELGKYPVKFFFMFPLGKVLTNSSCQNKSNVSSFPFLNGFLLFCSNFLFFFLSFFLSSLEINFQCLGDWIGHNGERYMALLDVQDTQSTTALTTAGGVGIINGAERRPRYRCAVRVVLYAPFLFIIFLLLFSFLSIVCSYSACSNFPSLPVKRKRRKSGNEAAQLGIYFG